MPKKPGKLGPPFTHKLIWGENRHRLLRFTLMYVPYLGQDVRAFQTRRRAAAMRAARKSAGSLRGHSASAGVLQLTWLSTLLGYFNGSPFLSVAAMVALVLATFALWIGGAFLGVWLIRCTANSLSFSITVNCCFVGFTVGPSQNNNAQGQCGVHLTVPLVNKDAYVFFLSVCTTIQGYFILTE